MPPKGWSRLPLGEIAYISSGGTPDRSEPRFWNGDIPWVTTSEIRFNTITNTVEKITEAGLKNSSAKLFPPGTLLMAMYGQGKTRGQVARLGISATTNQACAAIMLHDGHDSLFFLQVLSSQYMALRELGNAGTQQNLNGSIIKQVVVPVPPPIEQACIAKILAVWDSAITTRLHLLENNQKQKKALINLILTGRSRLSGYGGRWQKHILNTLCTFHKGGNLAKSDVVGSGIHSCILYGELFTTYDEVIETVKSRTDSESGFVASYGDVLIPTATTTVAEDLAKASALLVDGVLIGGDAIVIRPDKNKLVPEFLAYLLTYVKKREIAARAQGATIVHLSVGDIENLEISVPSVPEQIAIATVFRTLAFESKAFKRDMQVLKQAKKALMQQLLTGKRRVHVPKQTEAAST